MLKMGGAPRDRRIDRRKVAMAAAAVLFLFAAKVQAQNIVDFAIDPTQSWISFGINGGNTSATNGGFQPGNPDGSYNPATFLAASAQNAGLVNGGTIPAGSMNSGFLGHLYAAVNPGTSIQFYSQGNANMHNVTTGNYAPGENNSGNTDPTAPAQPGNIGARVTAIGALERIYGSVYDSLLSLDPTLSHPQALAITGGNNFDTAGLVLPQLQGYEDITTGIGAGPYKIGLAGQNYPISIHSDYDPNTGAARQYYVANNATVDPVTLHLVIPFNFVLFNEVTVGSNRDYQVVTIRGQIVANPTPEPSSVVLFGFGVVGLLSYAWRARKRKALVA